jgi:hypothetical protein
LALLLSFRSLRLAYSGSEWMLSGECCLFLSAESGPVAGDRNGQRRCVRALASLGMARTLEGNLGDLSPQLGLKRFARPDFFRTVAPADRDRRGRLR